MSNPKVRFNYGECKVISGVTAPKVERKGRKPSETSLGALIKGMAVGQMMKIPFADRKPDSIKSSAYTAANHHGAKVQIVIDNEKQEVHVFRKEDRAPKAPKATGEKKPKASKKTTATK